MSSPWPEAESSAPRALQQALFSDDADQVPLKVTIAWARGDTRVAQCADCGALVAYDAHVKLGPCPACGRNIWWSQHLPVGPFDRLS